MVSSDRNKQNCLNYSHHVLNSDMYDICIQKASYEERAFSTFLFTFE